ncbi:hypothetical protein ORI89_12955 [Sphingobacterium sp. UT-1RO-CII-1]|uniref:hypothetical protein n=1 Tax=Sphingobacterium sp. UT-1RO-CII-1 TaxID=2995225 RepID=UPI00227A270B|nr:hypothetical protein [Sphingobacterium sp. UT-1RO-CII-1]MCY4780564.1 hypothetical protein [Sphingobacterium sp. UT-1RO-CII-1]
MITFTQHNLGKLEDLLNDFGYKVRYEKGSFRTGACLIQNTRVILVNKFSNLEVRIQSLVGLIQEIEVDVSILDDKKKDFYKTIKKLVA